MRFCIANKLFMPLVLRVGPTPGHELVGAATGLILDKVGHQVSEVALRIDAVQLAGLDLGRKVGPTATSVISAGKHGVLAVQAKGLHG